VIVGVPDHTLILLVTSDDKVYWHDPTAPPLINIDLIDSDIQGIKGTIVTTRDIVDVANDPTHQGLAAHGISQEYRDRNPGIINKTNPEERELVITHPQQGLLSNALEYIGDQLEKSGKGEEALAAYTQGQKINPHNPIFYQGQLCVLFDAKCFEEAFPVAERALIISQESGDGDDIRRSQRNLGLIHDNLENYEQAEKAYREALTGDEQNAKGNLGLGRVLQATGRTEEARIHAEIAQRNVDLEDTEAIQEIQELLEKIN
jgi:tetratricopeptide (TPR) repeat protein